MIEGLVVPAAHAVARMTVDRRRGVGTVEGSTGLAACVQSPRLRVRSGFRLYGVGYVESVGVEEARRRPDGVTDATVEAVGLVSEALEYVERARGALYTFHQLMGGADLKLGEACERLSEAGHPEVADRLATEVVGRNALCGRWTFQIVEEFDDSYWNVFREHEQRVRAELQHGQRHVFESEMKERRRTHGEPGHEAGP